MNFTIEFTPFQADSSAQIMTTAVVKQGAETLWTEPIILNITGDITIEQIQEILRQRTNGFAARVEAIFMARQFVGITPAPLQT